MYAIFPLRHSWQSQGMNTGSHKDTKAIDCGVLTPYKDTTLYAPFDGTIVHVDPKNKGGGIAFQSDEKVHYANGIYDYMTVWTGHDNKPPKLGAKFKQGEVYSHMGNAGNVQTHCHLEVQKGKFKMATKVTSQGSYKFENTINPNEGLYLTEDTIFKYSNLKWKTEPKVEIVNPVERDETTNQLKVLVDSLRVRTGHSTKDSVLGFVQKNAIYNYYETYNDNTYIWYRIGDNQWIADNGEWLEIYAAVDYKQMCEALLEEINHLKETNSNLANENLTLKDKLKQIHELSKGE